LSSTGKDSAGDMLQKIQLTNFISKNMETYKIYMYITCAILFNFINDKLVTGFAKDISKNVKLQTINFNYYI